MAIFVNADNLAISPRFRSTLSPVAERERDQLFLDLLSARRPAQAKAKKPPQASLYEAFLVVWEQFEGDSHQAAVSARILAFHFLMERTRGRVVEEWLRPSPESPQLVVLDDAVVAAVGSVPLRSDGALLEETFVVAVRTHLVGRSDDGPIPVDPVRISGNTTLRAQKPAYTRFEHRNIAAQLLAHEAELTGISQSELAVSSQVCDKLRLPLSAIFGHKAFGILLSRALAMARCENEALVAVCVKEDGTLGGTWGASPEAGLILVANLISGPAILVGERLVRSMLRQVWPGLSVSAPVHEAA